MTGELMALPSYMTEGAGHGRASVTAILAEAPFRPGPIGAEHALAACNFLANVMFTAQIANGLHPRSAADFAAGEDRGSVLARAFLAEATVEVCCDYCGGLMATAMAAAAAGQMKAIHGRLAADQWAALTFALIGNPPF